MMEGNDRKGNRLRQGAARRPYLRLVGLARVPENATEEETAAFDEVFYQAIKEAIGRSKAARKDGDGQNA